MGCGGVSSGCEPVPAFAPASIKDTWFDYAEVNYLNVLIGELNSDNRSQWAKKTAET